MQPRPQNALRLFRCKSCGHKMRLTGGRCGDCYAEKEFWQAPALIWLTLGFVTLFTFLTLLAAAIRLVF